MRWSDQEIATLRAMAAAGETDATIAEAMGRTPGAIQVQRKRLGLAKRPGPQGDGIGDDGVRVTIRLPAAYIVVAEEIGAGNINHGLRLLVAMGVKAVLRKRKPKPQ